MGYSGRLDKLLYVPLPTKEDRVSIFKALVEQKVKLDKDVDLQLLADKADGFSGADCAALVREAGLAVLREGGTATCISPLHFDVAFQHVLPSVTKKDQRRYDALSQKLARARTRFTPQKEQELETATETSSSPPPPPTTTTTNSNQTEEQP